MQKTESSETKEIPLELEPAEIVQSDLYSYLTKFDDKVLITLKRQRAILKTKYYTMMGHLEKMKKQLDAYEAKVMKLETDIDENQSIRKILAFINIYKNYSKTLSDNFFQLEKKINEEEEKIAKNLILVNKKRKVIFQVNHENIVFSNNIARYQKKLTENKSLILPNITTTENTSILSMKTQPNNESMYEKEKTETLINKLKLYERKNQCLKKDILNKAFNFTETKHFFEECLDIYTKSVIKSQEIIKSDGLKGSLLFEIKKNKKNNELKDFVVENNPSNLQEREVKNLVFRTLNFLLEKKEGKKNQDDRLLGGLKLQWDTFKNLDGKQIIGLLVINPEVTDEFKKLFEIKQREINEALSDIKK